MSTYSVKEVAEMLNTNQETVRRWIRDKKLVATYESKKSGNRIQQVALEAFLKSSPKYAAVAAASSVAGAAIVTSVLIGGVVAQQLVSAEQLKKARVSEKDFIQFLRSEIKKCEDSISDKRDAIHQLEIQIDSDQRQIEEYKKYIRAHSGKNPDK